MEGAESVLEWLRAVGVEHCPESPDGLCDGVALFHACALFAPDFFDTSSIKMNTSANWVMCLGNLKKIVNNLKSYARDVLHIDADDALDEVDLTSLAKSRDVSQAMRLARLVVGAAVRSSEREKMVSAIMGLSKDRQATMMRIIKEVQGVLEGTVDSAATSLDDNAGEDEAEAGDDAEDAPDSTPAALNATAAESASASGEAETLRQMNEKLARELDEMRERADAAEGEAQKARAQAEEVEKERKANEEQLMSELQQARDDAARARDELESTTSENANAVSRKDEELSKLRGELDEAKQQALDVRAAKDELDYLRAQLEKAEQTAATAETLQKRLAEKEDENRRLREQTTRSADDLARTEDLERQLRTANDQIAEQREKARKLQAEAAEASQKLRKTELELANARGRAEKAAKELQSAQADGKRLRAQCLDLEEEIEAMKLAGDAQGGDGTSASGSSIATALSKPADDAATRVETLEAQLAVVRQELDTYRSQTTNANADSATLAHDLEDACAERDRLRQRVDDLDRENVDLKEQITDLSAKVEAASAAESGDDAARDAVRAAGERYKATITALKSQLEQVRRDAVEGVKKERETARIEVAREEEKARKAAMDAEQRVNDLVKKQQDAEEKLERASEEAKELHAKISKLHEEKDALVNQLHEAKEANLRNEADSRVHSAGETQRLQSEITSLRDKEKDLLGQIEILRKEKMRATASVEQAKEVIVGYKDKVNELKAKESTNLSETFEETLNSLRNQLLEKENEKELLRKRLEETKETARHEQQLMVSAFYDVGLQVARSKVNRHASPGKRSWLGQMRAETLNVPSMASLSSGKRP